MASGIPIPQRLRPGAGSKGSFRIAPSVTATLVGATGTASAATATVGNTDGDGLNVRTGPTTSSSVVGVVWDGTVVGISRRSQGDAVTNTYGFTSDLWDYVPGLGGYVAGAYTVTGHDHRVRACRTAVTTVVARTAGPTSVVTTLPALGVTPRSWDASYPVAAIDRVWAAAPCRDAAGDMAGRRGSSPVNRQGLVRKATRASSTEEPFLHVMSL